MFEDVVEAINEDYTHGNVAHGGGYVHLWGGISYMGKTSLCVLDQMSLEPFIAEFWRNTWFHMAGHGIATIGYWLMIMPDPHRACVVDAYLHEQDIIRMDGAPYRPDMNSIEHIWDEIGRGLEELDSQSVNLRQLRVVVQNLWQQIPLERVQTLVSSIPRRVRALVDARRSSTRY